MLIYLLIAISVIVSLIGFSMMNNPAKGRLFVFSPNDVAAGRNYAGMVLSHFSHADPSHLFFNILTLYSFGPAVERGLGAFGMLVVYVISGILSTVVVYYRHRSQPAYRALGASDSITGILFAAIVLQPGMGVYVFFIPVAIPGLVFAVGYIFLSTYFMQRGRGGISHEAHLAGAFSGVVLGGLLSPWGFEPLLQSLKSFLT